MRKRIALSCFVIFCLSCKQKQEPGKIAEVSVQQIVDSAIASAGGKEYDKKEICFDFRGKEYFSLRDSWKYELHRTAIDSLGVSTTDVLSNNGFKRFVEDSLISVPDSMALRYGNSVNSVHYFAYLPYGLNDKAVNKELLGEVTLKGVPYYKVKVSFNETGGGTDFEDVFIYWISKENYEVDYLAYEYHVNGGGMRFREAYNHRIVNGIRFVDYKNFKPKSKEASLYQLDTLFEEGQLELLSKIELENIYVQPCSTC